MTSGGDGTGGSGSPRGRAAEIAHARNAHMRSKHERSQEFVPSGEGHDVAAVHLDHGTLQPRQSQRRRNGHGPAPLGFVLEAFGTLFDGGLLFAQATCFLPSSEPLAESRL